jgi:uncharacterized protein YjbI with pentapeptide repeats
MIELQADCSRCVGLCCVALTLSKSADFAIDKPAGEPCPNLESDFRCRIHAELREQGFAGCVAYDCFGAGQHVVQGTFGGNDWRDKPRILEVFGVMRQLHELMWLLTQALALPPARQLHAQLQQTLEETTRLTDGSAEALLKVDVAAYRERVNGMLRRASELARQHPVGKDYAGADLVGAKLSGADLRGASLRGALLIGANLRGANLRLADVTGADFRDADIRGADLSTTLFLTQQQVLAARGDHRTKLPATLNRPFNWNA